MGLLHGQVKQSPSLFFLTLFYSEKSSENGSEHPRRSYHNYLHTVTSFNVYLDEFKSNTPAAIRAAASIKVRINPLKKQERSIPAPKAIRAIANTLLFSYPHIDCLLKGRICYYYMRFDPRSVTVR